MTATPSTILVTLPLFSEKRKNEVYCGLLSNKVFETVKAELGLTSARLSKKSRSHPDPTTGKMEKHFAVFTTAEEYAKKMQSFFRVPKVIDDQSLTVGTWRG